MTTSTYNDWQYKQINCTCPIHRYHVCHICQCGKLITHSQGDFNEHKHHGQMINIDPVYYKHGDTAGELFDRLNALGKLPYGTPQLDAVYRTISDQESKQ